MPKIRCSSGAAPQARWCDACRNEKDAACKHRRSCSGFHDLGSVVQDPLTHFACFKCGVESSTCATLHSGDCAIKFCRECVHHAREDDSVEIYVQRCPCGQFADMVPEFRRSSTRARAAFKDTFYSGPRLSTC